MKITGFVETYLTDKNGIKRKVGEGHNNIGGNFYKSLAVYLDEFTSVKDIQLTPLFTGGTGYTYSQESKSGIATDVSGGDSRQAAFATVLSQPAAHQLRATGTWTNPESGSKTLSNAIIGKDWIKNQGYDWMPGDGGYFNKFDLAEGGMADTVVPSGELITIVWTITFTVY